MRPFIQTILQQITFFCYFFSNLIYWSFFSNNSATENLFFASFLKSHIGAFIFNYFCNRKSSFCYFFLNLHICVFQIFLQASLFSTILDGDKTRNPGEENTESGDDFPGGVQNFRGGITSAFQTKIVDFAGTIRGILIFSRG